MLSPKASSPVIADTGSATTEHIPLHILNHKILTFISYLADFKHFEAWLDRATLLHSNSASLVSGGLSWGLW